MRYFFIEQPPTAGATALISGTDARHITTVLRLKPGDRIGLFDGKGFEYQARIEAVSSRNVKVAVVNRFPSNAESPVEIIVAQALLKERKMDGLVRQLSELGITQWLPFWAQRSIPRLNQKALAARLKRWQKIAKEALKQCKRGRVLAIREPASFESVLAQSRTCDLKIVFWEEESTPLTAIRPQSKQEIKTIFALLGPEGGFTAQEIEAARESGFNTAALGPRILKAETATVAACALLQYLYGDMGKRS